MSVNTYLKASTRDIFQWECIETTDECGMGGVAVEEAILKGRTATITRENEDEFEVDVTLKHPIIYDDEETYEVIDYRSSRKSARTLAERLIKNDLKEDIKITDKQLSKMRYCVGLDNCNKPYKNRFVAEFYDTLWIDLVEKKLVIFCGYYYRLTKFGVEFILGKNVSDKFYSKL